MLWIKQTKKPISPEHPKITEWNIEEKNNYLFFCHDRTKKTNYTKQDHSITSPESQNVIKMRTTKKTIKRVCMQENHCSQWSPKFYFSFSQKSLLLFFFLLTKERSKAKQRSETAHVYPNVKQWDKECGVKEMKRKKIRVSLTWSESFFSVLLLRRGLRNRKGSCCFFSCVIKIVVLGSENFVFTLLKWKSSPACVQYGMCLYNVFACREGQSQVGVSAYVLVFEREKRKKMPKFYL